MQLLKHLIKKYAWKLVINNKINKKTALENSYYLSLLDNSTTFCKKKLNIFTVHDEDGILLNIFAKINDSNKVFVDIGSNDCINSNCANLAFHHGWSGVFIDAKLEILQRGKYIYKKYFKQNANRFSFVHSIVTVKNIDEVLKTQLSVSEVDLLSIDLDGNDYFIWQAITAINPRVVITEVQVEKGNKDFIPEYTNAFELYEDNLPKGASPLSMVKLAATKGYCLVAVNNGGYNLFFVRKDCMKNLTELPVELAIPN